MKERRYWIGIDPGTNTGVAVWERTPECPLGRLVHVSSMMACEAEDFILRWMAGGYNRFEVHVEDTRHLKIPKDRRVEDNPGKLQGVGMVKRDMARWEEWLTYRKITHTMRPPMRAEARLISADGFRQLSGWTERTNEHGRAAAMLVLGQ